MKIYKIYRHTAETHKEFKYWKPGEAAAKDCDFEDVQATFDSLEEAQAEFQKSWYSPSASTTGMTYNLTGVEEYSLWVEDDEEEVCEQIDVRFFEPVTKYELKKGTMLLPIDDVFCLKDGITAERKNESKTETVKVFEDKWTAREELREYKSVASIVDDNIEIIEFYVEETVWEPNGEFMRSDGICEIADDNFDEVVEKLEEN